MTSTPPASAMSVGDQAAVAAIPQRVIAAWASQDAAAFAGVFTEDGTMILPGVYQKGQEDIQSFMTGAFAGPFKGTRVTGHPIDVRFLSPDVGIMITEGGVLEPGESELREERVIRGSWLVVKQDGQWRLAAYQNSPRATA